MTQVTENTAGNILVVDDTLDNLRLLTKLLKDNGYQVRASKTGREALASVQALLPELILLDIKLPDLNGYDVCAQLKAEETSSQIPVIFLSALDATADKLKGFEVGGVDYITKPFQPAEVLSRVQTHIKLSRMHAQLQTLNAEKDKFFSIIAHDLRSPLGAFIGLTEILDDGLFEMPEESLHKIVHTLRSSASNLFSLLENLLKWSQMKQGAINYNPEKIQLLPLIEENITHIIEGATIKQIEIRNGIPAGMEVFADPNMLHTILRNFITNAVKFTPKGGLVTISAKSVTEDMIEISIEDTGIGMNKDLISNLFKLDVNTGRKGTEGEPSTGLGLLLCKEFIEKIGGNLYVESDPEGKSGEKGSRFFFTLRKQNSI